MKATKPCKICGRHLGRKNRDVICAFCLAHQPLRNIFGSGLDDKEPIKDDEDEMVVDRFEVHNHVYKTNPVQWYWRELTERYLADKRGHRCFYTSLAVKRDTK